VVVRVAVTQARCSSVAQQTHAGCCVAVHTSSVAVAAVVGSEAAAVHEQCCLITAALKEYKHNRYKHNKC
jgi:hypothetical protein